MPSVDRARKLYEASLQAMALEAEALLTFAVHFRPAASSERIRSIINLCNEELKS